MAKIIITNKEFKVIEIDILRRKLFEANIHNLPVNKRRMVVENEKCDCLVVGRKHIKPKDLEGFLKTLDL